VEKVVLCEIDKMVVDVSREYLPSIAGELDNPKVEIFYEDAVEYIKGKDNTFDVILIDSTDPLGPGVGLFTEEFYGNARKALREGGILVAQSESPVANKNEIKQMYTMLKKAFPIVKTYTSPIPTYPGGYWAWAYCSETVRPLEYIDEERCAEVTKTCKVYNKEYHKARFALPTFLDELL